MTVKTTSSRTVVEKKNEQSVVEVSEVYDITLEEKVEFKEHAAALELKYQTKNLFEVTLSKSDVGVKGLKLKAGGVNDINPKDKQFQQTINVGAEFALDNLFFKGTAGVPLNNRPFTFTGNVVVKPLDNFFLGK